MTATLRIPEIILQQMWGHARRELPNECCGILGGKGDAACRWFPMRNSLQSPTAYEADVRDLFETFRSLRELDMEMVAIYHSHPSSPPVPSRADLERNYYEDTIRLILSPGESPSLRAWRLGRGNFAEVAWVACGAPL